VSLSWQQAGALAAALLLLSRLRLGRLRLLARARTGLAEAGHILALYALWQLVQVLLITRTAGAAARGRAVAASERALHLPAEESWQRAALDRPGLSWLADHYYAGVHFVAMITFLAWVFWRHRAAYPAVRGTVVALTGACFAVQLLPTAPPRLVSGLGVVDSAALAGRSVYAAGGLGLPDQLTAMPSVHVGWALLVGLGAVVVGRGRARWLSLAHPVVTVWAVVVTGNHYLLDGVVAAGLLALAVPAQAITRRTVRTWTSPTPGRSSVTTTTPSSSPAGPTAACSPPPSPPPSTRTGTPSSAPEPRAPRPATSGAIPGPPSAA